MDEAGDPQPSEQVLIDLKVLSPSTEVNGDLFFANIPEVTTVGELKIQIRDELATRPAVERMRLIYRGRVMAKDTDSMFDVFGRDNVYLSRTSYITYAKHLSRSSGLPSKACISCFVNSDTQATLTPALRQRLHLGTQQLLRLDHQLHLQIHSEPALLRRQQERQYHRKQTLSELHHRHGQTQHLISRTYIKILSRIPRNSRHKDFHLR